MRRFAFGFLWFIGLWLGTLAIGGAVVASLARANSQHPASDVASAYAQGHAVGQDFGNRYGGLLLLGAFAVAVVGSSFGILPGTKKKPPKQSDNA